MAIENVQQLLSESMGKNRCDVVTTTAMSGKDYYCAHFPIESVVTVMTAANVTAAAGSDGTITFDDTRPDNLDTTAQISLTGHLTIGIRLNITTAGKTIIADNTSAGEFLKSVDTTNLRFKFDGKTVDLALDTGTLGDGNLVITRTSNEWEVWWNTILQTDTEVQSGTVLLDNVGVRRTDINAFEGTIKEIQIYSAANASLTSEVINRLKSL